MLCKCGCGIDAGVYPKTSKRAGAIKGEERSFVRGHNSRVTPNMNEEIKRKLSIAHKGKTLSKETREKVSKAQIGKKHTERTKRKMSMVRIGKPKPPSHGKNVSTAIKGKKHWNWKGGITPIRTKLYFTDRYKNWRTSVFERDNYTCQWCRARSGNGKEVVLNADHIKPWKDYPELRFDVSNGRTLCVTCHRKTDTYGHKVHNIREGDTPENSWFAKHALNLCDEINNNNQ